MKRTVSLILSLIMVIGICTSMPLTIISNAANQKCGDNLTWTYENNTLTISGTGDMWDFVPFDMTSDEGVAPWYYIRYDIYDIVIEEGVTSIGSNAIFGNFRDIKLPVSVVKMSEDAISYTYDMYEGVPCGFYTGTEEQFNAISKDNSGYASFAWHYETDTHTSGDWVYEDFYSCESGGGYRYKYCIYCDAELQYEYTTGHVFVNNVCEICSTEYFECGYDEETKTATIYGYNGTSTKLEIPEYINGYRVTAIADCAFGSPEDYVWDEEPDYNNYRITEITIPDSVTSIGKNAFTGTGYYRDSSNWVDDCLYIGDCLVRVSQDGLAGIGPYECNVREGTRLIADGAFDYARDVETINIPSSVEVIGKIYWDQELLIEYDDVMDEYFHGFFISSINVSEDNPYYSSENGVLYNKDKTQLIKYPYCKSDKSFVIPDTVVKISTNSMQNYFLEELTIGASLESVSYYLQGGYFCYLENLTTINVSKYNKNFVSSDGVLFNADKTELMCYPKAKEGESYVIPDGVTIIASRAFCDTEIESVIIPESVSVVKFYVFENSSLKYVFYKGTKDKADSLLATLILSLYNTELKYATWHYEASYHTCGDWVIDEKATVNAEGSKHRDCTQCDDYTETAVIPQLKPATPKLSKVANTASGAQVTWGKVTGADSYIVYRRTYNAKTKAWGSWGRVASGVTSTSYVDKTVKSGTYYRYTVKAVNESGASGYNTSGIKTYFLSTPKVTSTANTNSGITIKWGKVSGATGYIVYRKTGNGKWTNLGKTTGISFTDKKATAGVTYRYTVKAYYGSYVSSYNSNGYAVRRLTTPKLSSATSNNEGVLLKWNKVTGATGYIVYRKASSGEWKAIATIKGNTKIKYLDETPRKGATYQYCVKAYYGTSRSANSNVIKLKCKY